MLVAKTVAFELYRAAQPLVQKLARTDARLGKDVQKTARQIVDAVTEGSGRQRGDKAYFYECAYASCEELDGKLEIAEIDGALTTDELEVARRLLDRERRLLWGLTHGT